DPRPRMDLDAGDEAAEVRDEPWHDRHTLAVQVVRQPVQPDGVQSWISEYDLDDVLGRRVTLEDRLQVLAHYLQRSKHPINSFPFCRVPLVPGAGRPAASPRQPLTRPGAPGADPPRLSRAPQLLRRGLLRLAPHWSWPSRSPPRPASPVAPRGRGAFRLRM